MCLTTEIPKLFTILLIFTNETLDVVIFPLGTGFGTMIYQLLYSFSEDNLMRPGMPYIPPVCPGFKSRTGVKRT